MARLGSRAMVRSQVPLNLTDLSVPEPDIAVVEPRADHYADAHPTTALLVVEVAATSLLTDRISKAAIYASADIREYWVVNLRDRCIEVHRQPAAAHRRFAQVRVVRPGESVDLMAFPGVTIPVDDLLPPPIVR
jgi:Uma2 family endonuclease